MGEKMVVRTVLVVDDDESILAAARRSLVRGRRVLTASESGAALSIARRDTPELAVVDLRLKDESGLDLVRALRAEFPQLAIVLLSGYLSAVTAIAAIQNGATAVMFKPMSFKEVVERVESGNPCQPVRYETPTLALVEWEHVQRVLAECNGNLSLAARQLGIYRSSLQRKLRKFAPPAPRPA